MFELFLSYVLLLGRRETNGCAAWGTKNLKKVLGDGENCDRTVKTMTSA